MTARPSRLVACGLAAAALTGTGIAPAAATAPPRTFWLLQSADVKTSASAGATISVIQVCPRGSTLDRDMSGWVLALGLDFESPSPPGYRLLSHENWVAGNVTRWRVTGRVSTRFGTVPLFSVAACRVTVPATTTAYMGRVRTKVRAWGPAAARAAVVIDASASGPISGLMMDGTCPLPSASQHAGVSVIGATASFTRTSIVVGHAVTSVRAGRYAEVGGWWMYNTTFQPQTC